MTVETRQTFHSQLDTVREEIIALAAAVAEVIPRGTAVLLDGDLEGAEYLIRADDAIDAQSIEIEERCYQLLALQQPMAGDLRRIIAALKIVGELERSADLVVNICKAARRLHGHDLDAKLRGIIARMSEQAHHLFRTALDAYAEADEAKAAAIDDMDNLLDNLQREFIQAIFESHATGLTDLQVGVQLAMVCRFYERIGDHAVNVGERVRYQVTGWMPEHAGAERHRRRPSGQSATEVSPES
jgi:phosphate transport system protein